MENVGFRGVLHVVCGKHGVLLFSPKYGCSSIKYKIQFVSLNCKENAMQCVVLTQYPIVCRGNNKTLFYLVSLNLTEKKLGWLFQTICSLDWSVNPSKTSSFIHRRLKIWKQHMITSSPAIRNNLEIVCITNIQGWIIWTWLLFSSILPTPCKSLIYLRFQLDRWTSKTTISGVKFAN